MQMIWVIKPAIICVLALIVCWLAMDIGRCGWLVNKGGFQSQGIGGCGHRFAVWMWWPFRFCFSFLFFLFSLHHPKRISISQWRLYILVRWYSDRCNEMRSPSRRKTTRESDTQLSRSGLYHAFRHSLYITGETLTEQSQASLWCSGELYSPPFVC